MKLFFSPHARFDIRHRQTTAKLAQIIVRRLLRGGLYTRNGQDWLLCCETRQGQL